MHSKTYIPRKFLNAMLLQLMLYAFSKMRFHMSIIQLSLLIVRLLYIILQCYGQTGIDCPQTYF